MDKVITKTARTQAATPPAPTFDAERRVQELQCCVEQIHSEAIETLSIIENMADLTLLYLENPGKYLHLDTIGQMLVGIANLAREKGDWVNLQAEGVDCVSVDEARDRRRVSLRASNA